MSGQDCRMVYTHNIEAEFVSAQGIKMKTWAGIIIPGLKIDRNKDGRLELGSESLWKGIIYLMIKFQA